MNVRSLCGAAALAAVAATPALASIPNSDIADNNTPYVASNSWAAGQNGGFGWGNWVHQISNPTGFAGTYLADSSSGDLNNIKSPNYAWGSYANGTGQQKFAAFRRLQGDDFNTANLVNGQSIIMSMEHGGIQQSGFAGMGWGSRAFTDADPQSAGLSGAIKDQALFGFYGGTANYTLTDSLGTLDTGIGWTDAGLQVTFTLVNAGSGSYNLTVKRLSDNQVFNFNNRQIAGGIDAISLYNFDTEEANVYFNSVSLVPAPGAAALMGLGGLLAARRRR
jgi:hypothetical protein